MFRRAGRRWGRAMGWILFFTFLITLAVGLYMQFYEPERYVAEYTLYALPPSVDEDATAPVRMWMLIRDYNRLLDDPDFRQEIVAQQESDGKTFISARGKATDHFITIRAVGRDAMIVGGLADAVGDRLVADSEVLLGVTNARTVSQARLQPQPTLEDDALRLAEVMLASFAILSLLAVLFGSRREPVGWLSADQLSLPVMGQVADCDQECQWCQKRIRKSVKRNQQPQERLLTSVNRLVREGVEETALSMRGMAGMQSSTVAITGVGVDDQAPALAVLMGQTLAEDGYSVLMMDLDGDKPMLSRYLGVSGPYDVADCLRDDSLLPQALQQTGMANLHLMDACHDGETLRQAAASPAFRTFIEDALAIYDYVLLNAPPVAAGAGAAAVCGAAMQTMIVASDRRYTAKEINQAAAGLHQRGANVSGVVFTGAKKRQLKGYYRQARKLNRKQMAAQA